MSKTKIFLTAFPEICQSMIEKLPKDVQVEVAFEQVIAMVRQGMVDRICIFWDANTNTNDSNNCMRGQRAAERIHKVDSTIPILIWEGREYDPPEFPDNPPVLQVSGELKPITSNEEIYMDFYSTDEKAVVTEKFYAGTLKETEIPFMDCAEQHFLQ